MNTMRLPDFLIIGAMKSGTTTLYRDLMTNPAIFFPFDKEPAHLTKDGVLTPEGRLQYAELFEKAGDDQICGEASTLSTQLPQYPGVPRRARELLGDRAKLIYLIRHPVERTISHHRHTASRGIMPTALDDALDSNPELLSYSQYAMQAKAWLKHFDREQLSFIVFEEFIRDRKGTIDSLSRFLGVEPQLDQIDDDSAYNVGDKTGILAGPWARVVRNPLYRKIIRPLLSRRTRDMLRGTLLPKVSPAESRPSCQILQRIIDAVAEDADQLRELMGRDKPIWNLDEMLEAADDESR